MTLKHSLRNLSFSIALFISIISSVLALDPNVQALVDFETLANKVALRSNEKVDIEHYEIPLELVGSDIAERMDQSIKDALIFKKNGQDYVRWVINPEDTQWHLEVKQFLESKGLDASTHTHLKGYMTASRSYIVEDLTTGAQFSIKVSTNKTGGHWKNKHQQIQDAKEIRQIAEYVYQEQQAKPFQNLITMDEPGIFSLEALDQAMVIRTLDGLVGNERIYLPGFSAVHSKTGREIALRNGSTDPEQYWRENYNKPLAKALAELAVRTGLTYDSPHSQNFLIELDSNYRPTGKIVIRDFGDSYLCKDIVVAKGFPEIPANWTPKYVKEGVVKITVGIMHGNTYPVWLSDEKYEQWGEEFFTEYQKEFSRLTGIPKIALKANNGPNGAYFSGRYKIQGEHWETFITQIENETIQRATHSGPGCRTVFH